MTGALLAAAPTVVASSTAWLSSAVVSAIAAALVAGVFATIQGISSKKLRTPADRLSEVQFYVELAQRQVAEAREDKKGLQETVDALRAYGSTLEGRGREDQDKIRALYSEIAALERRSARKDALIAANRAVIDRIADKLRDEEPITLADLEPLLADPSGRYVDTGSLATMTR